MISVVIPTYNNQKQFLSNFRHNLPFFSQCEVLVVNDFPDQSLKNELKEFTQIILIENKKNLGFSGAVHAGISQAKNNLVMLLNDDVLLSDNAFLKSHSIFNKKIDLFAIGFAQKEKNNLLVGKNKLFWKNGFIQHNRANNMDAGYTAWAEGGACIIDKKKYALIGGFDELYSPFYWEDVDLSYRAWKSGYCVLFDPTVQVVHHHESTIGHQFNKSFISEVAYRNQLFFIWRNIADKKLLLDHFLHLFPMLATSLIQKTTFKTALIKALLKNLHYLPIKNAYKKRSDKEVLNILSKI